MVNYGNGKIYKIEAINGEDRDIYVGSTTKKYLCQRMVAHREDYDKWKNGYCISKLTSFDIFDKYGVDNCQIILLETFSCNSRDELTSRESHYIRTLECVNKVVPNRSKAEYYQDNRPELLAYFKERHEKIKEVTNAKKKENRYTCECGSELRVADRCKHVKTKKHLAFIAIII